MAKQWTELWVGQDGGATWSLCAHPRGMGYGTALMRAVLAEEKRICINVDTVDEDDQPIAGAGRLIAYYKRIGFADGDFGRCRHCCGCANPSVELHMTSTI